MANKSITLGAQERTSQAAWGAQAPLIIAAVPTGGDASLIGQNLVDAGQLTTLGVYRCLIPISGCVSSIQVHLTATFASGTVTSDLDTLYWVRTPSDTSTWSKKTAGSGDGSLTTTVLQTSTIGTLTGEQFAVLDITLATAAACTFTRAEWNGL